MNIRNAEPKDLAAIFLMIDQAKAFMSANGNPNQWIHGYPQHSLIEEDIAKKQGYVCEEAGCLYAYFMLLSGDEPDYGEIDGAWLNDLPYLTLHRIMSTGEKKGMVDMIVSWCLERSQNLRGDTYKDNLHMQRAFERNGFIPCGTIWIDGRRDMPRIAYQHPPA